MYPLLLMQHNYFTFTTVHNYKLQVYCILTFLNNNFVMSLQQLSFIANNPGAVKFGNFINYYTFHSSKERTNNLDPKMFPATENDTIIGLDIGCNTGELTKDLYLYLKNIYPKCKIKLLGIDIDPILIQRAKEENNFCDLSFETCDVVTDTSRQLIHEYKEAEKKLMFDIIFCFSVTMWIHINNGDEELMRFLNFLKHNARALVIEPQPWKCYKNAQRRMKKSGKSFELYQSLSIRDNVDTQIEEVLCKNSHKKVYESSLSSWNRKIQSYHLIIK